jgi:alpha-glucosidase
MLHHYRRAIALRKAHPALAVGTHDQLRAEGNVAFFTRQDRDEVIFCVFNLGDAEAEITLPEGTWQKPNTDIALADLPTGGARVVLAPWQACLAVRG